MARRLLVLALLALLFVSSQGLGQQQTRRRDLPPTGGTRQITFKDILVRELRVRFPKEEIFVNRVVELTEKDGAFTQQFVLAVARNAQQRNIIFPFPYFQAMMVKIAEVKRVNLRPL